MTMTMISESGCMAIVRAGDILGVTGKGMGLPLYSHHHHDGDGDGDGDTYDDYDDLDHDDDTKLNIVMATESPGHHNTSKFTPRPYEWINYS